MDRTPCLLVGDGPQEPTGLGRIARDIGRLITDADLPLDLVSVGGPILPHWEGWPHVPMGEAERGDDWGAAFVTEVWRDRWGQTPGILWLVWDPARCYPYLEIPLPVQRWVYPAIDSVNVTGTLSGPPAEVLARFDRVLAYGRWASWVIRTVREEPVPYLPHGLQLRTFATHADEAWVAAQLGPHIGREDLLIGCVATNQARKDLALYFEALGALTERGRKVYGWLHTDTLTRAWSIDQLVADTGLAKRVTVTLGTLTDRQLGALYRRCDVTIAPGLGEGFGYPIVESLAAGVPVVHGDFGGGRELVPTLEWRFPVREVRRESVYGLTRPIYRPHDVANAVERVLAWRETVGRDTAAAYCRGAVAHLDWAALGGRWAAWIKGGL